MHSNLHDDVTDMEVWKFIEKYKYLGNHGNGKIWQRNNFLTKVNL